MMVMMMHQMEDIDDGGEVVVASVAERDHVKLFASNNSQNILGVSATNIVLIDQRGNNDQG
jgi:hypothetical protein